MHDFQLAGAELIFTRGHHADGGRTFSHGEADGFDGAVEVLVDLEHLRFLGMGWNISGGHKRGASMPKRLFCVISL